MSVVFQAEGAIATITIDRPERRNAVDLHAATALFEAFNRFEHDDQLSVAILTGAGGAFCAGADLQAIAEGTLNPTDETAPIGPMGPTRMQLSKPVIAAIEGPAVAGGLELAIWADLRVAGESAVFGVFCRRFGVPLIDLGTIRLPRLIGQSRASDLILTGREVKAAEAHEIGLVNRLVPDGTALQVAQELALSLSRFPQTCLRNDRRSMLEQWDLPLAEAQLNEIRLGLETIGGGETLEGATRFSGGAGRQGKF